MTTLSAISKPCLFCEFWGQVGLPGTARRGGSSESRALAGSAEGEDLPGGPVLLDDLQ